MLEVSAVRGSISKCTLLAIDALPKKQQERILSRVPPSSLVAVRQTLGVGWVPMSDHIHLFDSTGEMLTPLEFREFWKHVTMLGYTQPILKAVWDSAIRLFGPTPHALLRGAPQVWKLITRNIGDIICDPPSPEKRAILHMVGIPSQFMASGHFPEGMAGAFLAFYTLTNTSGVVTVKKVDKRLGNAVFMFEWI